MRTNIHTHTHTHTQAANVQYLQCPFDDEETSLSLQRQKAMDLISSTRQAGGRVLMFCRNDWHCAACIMYLMWECRLTLIQVRLTRVCVSAASVSVSVSVSERERERELRRMCRYLACVYVLYVSVCVCVCSAVYACAADCVHVRIQSAEGM
jgi:hypothetical protein